MAPRTLTTAELRRALLVRQGLLEPYPTSLPRAVERMGGIQSQYAPSAYLGLRARLAGFERPDLTRALQRKSVVQGTLMRATIHIVSRADYWPLAAAIEEPRRDWWRRVARHDQTDAEMARAVDSVRAALADGPRKRKELCDELGLDAATWNGVGMWLHLVRVPPSGTWERRRADLYGLAEHWIGPGEADPEAGRELLVRRYLRAFGPAAAADVAAFTNFPMGVLGPVLDRLRLRRFEAEDGTELIDVPRAPLPGPDAPPPGVIFLGTWDAVLLVHARRTQILPEEHRAKVFNTKTPQSVATFLVDGQVAGSWRYDDGAVTIEPFGDLARRRRDEVEAAAADLAEFMS